MAALGDQSVKRACFAAVTRPNRVRTLRAMALALGGGDGRVLEVGGALCDLFNLFGANHDALVAQPEPVAPLGRCSLCGHVSL